MSSRNTVNDSDRFRKLNEGKKRSYRKNEHAKSHAENTTNVLKSVES